MRLSRSDIYARLACTALLIWLTSFSLAPTFGLPSKRPLSKDWKLIAESNIIAKGTIDAPLKTIKQMEASKKSDYINIQVDIHELYKGKAENGRLTVRDYLGFDWFARRPGALGNLIGKEVLVFLLYVDEPGVASIYFVDRSPSAVRVFDKEDLLRVKSEIANQSEIVDHFDDFPIAKKDGWDKKVQSLLTQLTADKTQDQAWEKLLKLPSSSAAALIRAMNDNRMLGHPEIELPLRPGPHIFESVAHYGPKTILDAVSILLDDKTRASIGHIANGGSDRERHTVLNAWRVWACYSLGPGTKGVTADRP